MKNTTGLSEQKQNLKKDIQLLKRGHFKGNKLLSLTEIVLLKLFLEKTAETYKTKSSTVRQIIPDPQNVFNLVLIPKHMEKVARIFDQQ